jgi:hypothetical protein
MAPERITTPYPPNFNDWITQQGMPFLDAFDPNKAVDALLKENPDLYTDFESLKRQLPGHIKFFSNSDDELRYMLQQRRDAYLRDQYGEMQRSMPVELSEAFDELKPKDKDGNPDLTPNKRYLQLNPNLLDQVRAKAYEIKRDYVPPAVQAGINLNTDNVENNRIQLLLQAIERDQDRSLRQSESADDRRERKESNDRTFDIEIIRNDAETKRAQQQQAADLEYAKEVNRSKDARYDRDMKRYEKEKLYDGLERLGSMLIEMF